MSEPCVYQENGYESRMDYLKSLSENYGMSLDMVLELADIMGPSEDFDGLVTEIEDWEGYEFHHDFYVAP